MKTVVTKAGSRENLVANSTLTLVGANPGEVVYSDLGLDGQMKLYRERLARSCPTCGQWDIDRLVWTNGKAVCQDCLTHYAP